ncbi:MAG: hypothetical protein K2J36_03905 [Ruminococcus sp.]|nr:hypothetical protein [Ruminococcus sp.]MDE6797139.1 hypothetical protein [Ruminococcus sp.]
MKNIRNLTALMSCIALAMSIMTLPLGTGQKISKDDVNISISMPDKDEKFQNFANSLKEEPVDDCTVEAFDDTNWLKPSRNSSTTIPLNTFINVSTD